MTSTTVMEPVAVSNRRQPVRQTRTNPPRISSQTIQPAIVPDEPNPPPEEHGFFPAITHFTDAIGAIPREIIRHFTMLREVDAKLCGPEEKLAMLINTCVKSHAPKLAPTAQIEALPETGNDDLAQPRFAHRRPFLELREELKGLLLTQDEKNHVMSTAVDDLEKQLKRVQSSYPHIAEEISDEARLGSMTHWAYNTEKPMEKKSMIGSERTRRAANHLENDAAASRSEARREAMAARKGKATAPADSDFDDPRNFGRKAQGGGKGRKAEQVYGLGISNTAPPNKRRKVEHLTTIGTAMGRVASGHGANGRGASPAIDSKKKPRNGGAAANSRKRGGTLESPNLASSPTVGTFHIGGKNRNDRSPAPSTLQRNASSRARQISNQANSNLSRNRSISTANGRVVNGNTVHTNDVDKVSALTGKSTNEIRNNMKESQTKGGNALIETSSTTDNANDMRGALVIDRNHNSNNSSTNNSRTRGDRPPSISTRGGNAIHTNSNSKSASKNPTPRTASFSTTITHNNDNDNTRTSRPRNGASNAPKRSHKKGAGIAAQAAAQAAAARVEGGASRNGSPLGGEDEEDGTPIPEGEERYCYCNDYSYGEMVGCDGEGCLKEWFHLPCIGLSRPPAKNAKWYCDDCKERIRRR